LNTLLGVCVKGGVGQWG